MKKPSKPFTVIGLKSLQEGRHTEPGRTGLYYYVRGNSRTFVFRYRKHGKLNEIGLGAIDLKEARTKVAALRAGMADGKDPRIMKTQAAPKTTFKDDAYNFYDHRRQEWVPDHARNWLKLFENHVFPHIGDRQTADLKTADLVLVLEKLWKTKHKTAFKIYLWTKAIIDRAIRLDDEDHPRFTRSNPSLKVLDALPKGYEPVGIAHPTIPWQEAPDLWKRLEANPGAAARALQFLLLCGTPRSGEIVKARWSEINNDNFFVPAERVKSGRDRDIPLVPAAQKLLAGLERRNEYIFPGRAGKHVKGEFISFSGAMHQDAMQNMLRDEFKMKQHVHGLRACFRGWVTAHALSVQDHDAAEACLDHVIGTRVGRAYDRGDLYVERRSLQERWATFLIGS